MLIEITKNLLGNQQWLYRYKNDLGASVIRESNNLFEVAIIKFIGKSNKDFHVYYDSNLSNSIFQHVDDIGVINILFKIEEHDKPSKRRKNEK